jgi:phosphate acyltransferase
MKLGVDILGGDFAPNATIDGCILAQQELKNTEHKIVMIGNALEIQEKLNLKNIDPEIFEIIDAPQNIEMNEHPVKAFVAKPNSSVSVGFQLLKSGQIDSFSSCGNTGAMLVGAVQVIKPIAGIIRPCITSLMPKLKGGVGVILDVGTNADCKPELLYQFGILGSIYAQYVYGIDKPKVGLMSIGEEEEKGNIVTQATHQLMKNTKDFNFIGNVEGRDILSSNADVYVCDGHTGNVILKEAEAFYVAIKKRKIEDEFFDRFNYELYGGTPILGINRVAMIGHGISSALAVKNMILLSLQVAQSKIHEKIEAVLAQS